MTERGWIFLLLFSTYTVILTGNIDALMAFAICAVLVWMNEGRYG